MNALAAPDAGFRIVPHNPEAEQALLGALLVNNEVFDRVADYLQAEYFYDPLHRKIFEIIALLVRANKVATPITVKTFLANDASLAELNITQFLAALASQAVSVYNAEDYAATVRDLALRRMLIGIGQQLTHVAFDSPVDLGPREQIEAAERQLYQLAENGRYDGGFLRFGDAIKVAIDMAAAAFERDDRLSGIATGLSDLDHMMGGLQSSDLIILAGRPGMGKTALATNIAFNVANQYTLVQQPDGTQKRTAGGVVGFFSLEMSAEQLATRILSEQAEISSERIRRGKIDSNEFAKLAQVSQTLSSAPLYIDQTGGISIAQLAARARRLKRQRGLDVLIVDYLQLLTGSSKRGSENRVQEITEITTGLKALAKELQVPIIALSQLSRQVENREDKRPQLSDLRESGSIEQDADVVMFVYREEYYVKGKKPREGTPEFEKWLQEMEAAAGKAEVIIGKQRHGPTGTMELQFESEFTRFSNLAKAEYLPQRVF